jgi:predicted RNA-binding protein with RPS1 domain
MRLKFLKTGLALSLVMMIAVTGCKKETTNVADDSAKYDAQLVIDDADVSYNEAVVSEGGEDMEFSSVNEGLPEAYTLIETDMDDAGFKRGGDKRYFACLKKLNLTDTQIVQIRKALRAYEECKAMDIKRHREAYAKLVLRVESSRKELVAKLRAGKITKEQFEKEMKALRADFEQSLRYIKASFAKTLKGCYEKFMRATKEILTERQWKAFVDCYR